MFIPDPGSASKNLSILNQKRGFLRSMKYDPGCSSRIRILTFYPSLIQGTKAQDPGSATLEKNVKVLPVFDVAHVLEYGHDHRPDLLDLDHREALH
jgi:hypothetical protein